MDKITLTRKAFERWRNQDLMNDLTWKSLVAESQKPELIERWAVVLENANFFVPYDTKEEAQKWANNIPNSRVMLICAVV